MTRRKLCIYILDGRTQNEPTTSFAQAQYLFRSIKLSLSLNHTTSFAQAHFLFRSSTHTLSCVWSPLPRPNTYLINNDKYITYLINNDKYTWRMPTDACLLTHESERDHWHMREREITDTWVRERDHRHMREREINDTCLLTHNHLLNRYWHIVTELRYANHEIRGIC